MAIVQAGATAELRWLLTLRSAASLDDDLGMFGTWVGPRTGPDKRTHGQKEDYVLRRFLVGWRECGLLRFPVEVQAETDREGEPDFVLVWPDKASLGVEVTEVEKRLQLGGRTVVDIIEDGTVSAVVNTVTRNRITMQDGFQIRRSAVMNHIPCFTSIDTARCAVESGGAVETALGGQGYSVKTLAEYLDG